MGEEARGVEKVLTAGSASPAGRHRKIVPILFGAFAAELIGAAWSLPVVTDLAAQGVRSCTFSLPDREVGRCAEFLRGLEGVVLMLALLALVQVLAAFGRFDRHGRVVAIGLIVLMALLPMGLAGYAIRYRWHITHPHHH